MRINVSVEQSDKTTIYIVKDLADITIVEKVLFIKTIKSESIRHELTDVIEINIYLD